MNTKEKENALSYLEKTKADAMQYYAEACEDVERWGQVINDCEDEMLEIRRFQGKARNKVMAYLVIVTLLVLIKVVAGCQTVKGVTGDAGWILTKMSDNIQVENK